MLRRCAHTGSIVQHVQTVIRLWEKLGWAEGRAQAQHLFLPHHRGIRVPQEPGEGVREGDQQPPHGGSCGRMGAGFRVLSTVPGTEAEPGEWG